MRAHKFVEGQLVHHIGHTSKPYKVLGYNGAGMVITIPLDVKYSHKCRLFLENQLEEWMEEVKSFPKLVLLKGGRW